MMGALDFCTNVSWGPREETPRDLATRLLSLVQRLRAVDPVLSNWHTSPHYDAILPLKLDVSSIAEEIAIAVVRSDDGSPSPMYGCNWTSYNSNAPSKEPRAFRLGLNAGAYGIWACNSIHLATESSADADLSLISFALFKGALLAMADAFDANVGKAFSFELSDLWTQGRDAPRLTLSWMTYLGPRFAHFANPPPSAIVERRPNGGLFMAATDEVFLVDDPEHLSVARDIHAAVALFNALPKPYPGLELPED